MGDPIQIHIEGEEEMRFSDKELILLQQKLDCHIQEYREYRELEADRWDNLIDSQQETNNQIKALAESTKGIVEAWNAAMGTIQVLSLVGKLCKWLASLAVLGAAVAYLQKIFS